MKGFTTSRAIAVLLGLVLIVGGGNLWATFQVVRSYRHQRSEQICSALGPLLGRVTSPDVRELIDAQGSVYNCDWSQP